MAVLLTPSGYLAGDQVIEESSISNFQASSKVFKGIEIDRRVPNSRQKMTAKEVIDCKGLFLDFLGIISTISAKEYLEAVIF